MEVVSYNIDAVASETSHMLFVQNSFESASTIIAALPLDTRNPSRVTLNNSVRWRTSWTSCSCVKLLKRFSKVFTQEHNHRSLPLATKVSNTPLSNSSVCKRTYLTFCSFVSTQPPNHRNITFAHRESKRAKSNCSVEWRTSLRSCSCAIL